MIDPINDPTGRKAAWAARAAMLREAAAKATAIRLNAKTVTLRFASGFEDRQPFSDVVKLIPALAA